MIPRLRLSRVPRRAWLAGAVVAAALVVPWYLRYVAAVMGCVEFFAPLAR